MEIRIAPHGYVLHTDDEPVPGAVGEDGLQVTQAITMVTFHDGADFIALRFTPEKWAEVLEYLNDPPGVTAARAARAEARARLTLPESLMPRPQGPMQ